MIEFINLKESLKSKFFPVYALCGDDQWLKNKSLENIKASLEIELPEMNCYTYEDGADVDELINACNTLPFFSRQKLVVVHNFVFPNGKKATEVKDKLASFSAHADDSCVLVFVTDDDKQFKTVGGVQIVNCKRLDERAVVSWIVAYCRRQGRAIDNAVATKIGQYCLCDMSRVATETEKLCSYASAHITADDVELLVHKDSNYEIFKLSEMIANKNSSKALETLQGLLNRGEQPRMLFGLLYNFYRRMYYAKTTTYSAKELASMLGANGEWQISQAVKVAQNYKPIQLKRALDCFASTDEKIKKFFNEIDEINMLVLNLLAL